MMIALIVASTGLVLSTITLMIVYSKYVDASSRCDHIADALEDMSRMQNQWEKKALKLERRIPEKEEELCAEYKKFIDERLAEINTSFETDNVHTMSQALCGQSATVLKNEMKKIIEKTYSKMSQELLGSIGDETDGVVRDLEVNICDRIWDSFQQVKVKFKDSPYILPDNAKMAYTKGCRTVFVIEQKPQIRTTSFTSSLLSNKERLAALSQVNVGSDSVYRFSLSYPFVYFFIAFDNGSYQYHQVHFRNKPITTAREHVYLAPIPNVHRGNGSGSVMCMGTGFSAHSAGNMCQQCSEVVSEFWQRPFNEHLGNGGKIDNKISSYAKWQKESLEDPLFILKINWGKGKTAKKVIDDILKMRDRKDKSDHIDKETRKLLEDGVKQVVKKIKDEIDSAKKNHTLRAGDLESTVRKQLETVVTEHSRNVFVNCSKE